MKLSTSMLVGLALCAPLSAQNGNDFFQNCTNWLWVLGNNPSNNANPTAFQAGQPGIAPGTETYRIIYEAAANRRETRDVRGFRASLTPSSATTVFPGTNLYMPEMKVRPTMMDPTTGNVIPDMSQPAALTYAQMPWMPAMAGFYWLSINMGSAMQIPGAGPSPNGDFTNLAVTMTYSAMDNASTPETVGHWISAFETALPPTSMSMTQTPYGYVDPAGVVTPETNQSPLGYSAITLVLDDPVVNVVADWGVDPQAALQAPPGIGYGPGNQFSTLSSAAGNLGFHVFAEGYDGFFAIPLLNIGGFFPAGIPLPGALGGGTLELNLVDPSFTALSGVYANTITSGEYLGASFPLPNLGPTSSGVYVGVEFLLVDIAALQIVDTTNSTWFVVN